MYVCICNAVSENDVHNCVSAGAASTRQVKNACGWKPGCGSCTARLAEVIGRARVSAGAESLGGAESAMAGTEPSMAGAESAAA